MPDSVKRPGTTASQSFNPAQVGAVLQLFRAVSTDPQFQPLMNNDAMLNVRRKFIRMKAKMDHDRLELDVDYWLQRLEEAVPGVEVMNPRDPSNPAPGEYTVAGRHVHRSSPISVHHAAVRYLAQVTGDREALEALRP